MSDRVDAGFPDQVEVGLAPLESVVTQPASREPQPDSRAFRYLSQRGDVLQEPYGAPNHLTEAIYGTSNTSAPNSFWVNDAPFSSPFSRQRQEEEVVSRKRSELVALAAKELEKHREVLRRLKAWHDWHGYRHKSLKTFLLSKIGYPRRPHCPDESNLLSLAKYYFPPRAELEVVVCDYGDGRFRRFEESIGKIESLWVAKPQWATQRWIHVPIGLGLLSLSLEEMFLYEGPGYSHCFGSDGTRFPHCEVLTFRERQYLQDQVDVFNILRDLPTLRQKLDSANWAKDRNDSLLIDIQWRAKHYGTTSGFWDLARSDLPGQLTEGAGGAPIEPNMQPTPEIDEQILSRHKVYSDAVLVRDSFQCIHRGDGMLLTMSPAKGIHNLDKDSLQILRTPPNAGIHDREYHILEHLRRQGSGIGCFDAGFTVWSAPNVECLMLAIITGLQWTPTKPQPGKGVSAIQDAYIPIVRDLRRRRGSKFKRHQSVNLVREYITCMNEIAHLYEISEQRIRFLEGIREQWQTFEEQLLANKSMDPQRTGEVRRSIDDTIKFIWMTHKNLPRLQDDLKSSLDVLFQLRTIEQNELAIIAESNNKAILVFTVVTIIFLPLSFFTSYFGMNLKGVIDTDRTERYFWAVCGSVTIFVVSMTVVFGFQNRLHAWIWDDRKLAKRKARDQGL